MLGLQESGRAESTESCTLAHLFLMTFAKDLAGDPRSPVQQFVLLDKGLNLSYQNSELEEVLVKTLIGYQKTKISATPSAQDLGHSVLCIEKTYGVSF